MYTLQTAAIVLAIASFGAAQSLAGVPNCAIPCVTDALPANCNLDPKCICESDSFISDIACCVSTACDQAGQDAALAYAKNICAPVGVTDLPTAATCAPGQGNSTSSTASDSSASTSGSSSSSSGASATGSGASSSASTSASGAANSESSSATGSAGPAATSASAAGGNAVRSVGLGLGVGLLGVAALL